MACLEPFDDLLALGMKVSAEKRMDHVDRKSVQKRLHNEKKKKKGQNCERAEKQKKKSFGRPFEACIWSLTALPSGLGPGALQ